MKNAGVEDFNLISSAVEEIVRVLANKSKNGDFSTSIAPILPWKKHSLIRDNLDRTWEDLRKKYGKVVHFIPKVSKLAFGTGSDDVHLVDKSRERFFNHVVESSLEYFVKERIEGDSTMEEGEDISSNDRTIIPSNNFHSSTPVPERLGKRKAIDLDSGQTKRYRSNTGLEEEVHYLRTRMEQRWRSDALIFAKHDEEIDTIRNQKNLERIVISGVLIDELQGNIEQTRPIMIAAVNKILNSFMDDPPVPTYVKHLNPQFKTPRRVIEVRFENPDLAVLVRKTYSNKIKDFRKSKQFPNEINRVNFGMTLTKSTRIRIAILKGLAKIVNDNTEPAVAAYCLEFQTQPMLKIVIEIGENKFTSRSYGFTEAIEHVSENFRIMDRNLVEAYTLAGNMKQLEQKFVVLKTSAPHVKY